MMTTDTADTMVAEARQLYREKDYLAAHELLCHALEVQPGHQGAQQGLRILEAAMRRSGVEVPASPAPETAGATAAFVDPQALTPEEALAAELRAWKAS